MHSTPPPFELDRPAIATLVQRFYDDVRADPRIGPVFDGVIGAHWPEHIARLTDFWCTVMLATGEFQGNVFGKHMAVNGIDADHFVRWLGLFEKHVTSMFTPPVSNEFMSVARRIASSLQLGLLRR